MPSEQTTKSLITSIKTKQAVLKSPSQCVLAVIFEILPFSASKKKREQIFRDDLIAANQLNINELRKGAFCTSNKSKVEERMSKSDKYV